MTCTDKLKTISKRQYKDDPFHKQKVKARSNAKYHGSAAYRLISRKNRSKRLNLKKKVTPFDVVMTNFLNKVKDGPDFVCFNLFKPQALQCRKSAYAIAALAEACISKQYLHKCSQDCAVPCQWLHSARGTLWICSAILVYIRVYRHQSAQQITCVLIPFHHSWRV